MGPQSRHAKDRPFFAPSASIDLNLTPAVTLRQTNSALIAHQMVFTVKGAPSNADAGARLTGHAMLIGALVLLLVAACSRVAQNDGGRQIVPGVEASDAVGGDLGTELVRMHASHLS